MGCRIVLQTASKPRRNSCDYGKRRLFGKYNDDKALEYRARGIQKIFFFIQKVNSMQTVALNVTKHVNVNRRRIKNGGIVLLCKIMTA